MLWNTIRVAIFSMGFIMQGTGFSEFDIHGQSIRYRMHARKKY
ncbi:hypothetical protein [Sphingobacterium faecale]|nr:hypothetical protein [Sphingobacterium faecale]